MTFFFFVVGLEARREFDLGELRERRRLALPLARRARRHGRRRSRSSSRSTPATPSAHGWGAAMSTDTAFALGLLALVGPRFPDRLRAFLLTVAVVDDIVALVVIAIVYTERARPAPLLAVAVALSRGVLVSRARRRPARASSTRCSARPPGSRCSKSGVDPVVVGLAMGLLTYAYPAARGDLERATELFRLFREQPTPELARVGAAGLAAAISPNERLQQLCHPWTSYVIVPLFALANAGIADRRRLPRARAFTSPITLGILVGYVVGKPVGIVGASWLVDAAEPRPAAAAGRLGRGRRRRRRSPGSASPSSLLIATLAFSGDELEEAKVGDPGRGARRVGADLARLPRDGAAAAGACGSARCSAPPSRSSTSPSPVDPRARPHPRPARRARHARRVRRLRVPVLRQAEPVDPRAARATSATSATSGATCR